MTDFRIRKHPILPIPQRKSITFYWQGTALEAQEGETISAALFANGIRTFGHHPHDGAPRVFFAPMDNVPNAWSLQMGDLLNPAWNW